jgi:hypothetical protein
MATTSNAAKAEGGLCPDQIRAYLETGKGREDHVKTAESGVTNAE